MNDNIKHLFKIIIKNITAYAHPFERQRFNQTFFVRVNRKEWEIIQWSTIKRMKALQTISASIIECPVYTMNPIQSFVFRSASYTLFWNKKKLTDFFCVSTILFFISLSLPIFVFPYQSFIENNNHRYDEIHKIPFHCCHELHPTTSTILFHESIKQWSLRKKHNSIIGNRKG